MALRVLWILHKVRPRIEDVITESILVDVLGLGVQGIVVDVSVVHTIFLSASDT
jgi:hypothetical protein